MAMIKCPECSAEVSDSAFDCPKCAATLKKPTRTFFGKIIKWLFISFNIIMLLWIVSGVMTTGEMLDSAESGAEEIGTAIGAGLGAIFLFSIWVVGDIIIGMIFLFTRPSK